MLELSHLSGSTGSNGLAENGAVTKELLRFHESWGYFAIAANAVAGALLLASVRLAALQKRWIWWPTIGAELALLVQVLSGTILVSANDLAPPRFHMFYGYVAFITIGMLFSYRRSLGPKASFWYGLTGFFLMGLGIRAVMQIA